MGFHQMYRDMTTYLGRGGSLMIGAEPMSMVQAPGSFGETWGIGGHGYAWNSTAPGAMRGRSTFPRHIGKMAGAGSRLFAGLTVAGSAYNLYAGYKEDGLIGAAEAGWTDMAASAAIAKFGFKWPASKAGISKIEGRGWMSMAGRGAGAYAGGTIGGMVGGAALGAPGYMAGSVVGSALGAAPWQTLKFGFGGWGRAGLAVGAVGAAAGLAGARLAAKGTYSVLKAGKRYRDSQRGIHTGGDMSAFMTQGAMTMRGRAVAAIHKSHMNARSALGQEANFMHMPSRNYHSIYR